MGAALNEAMIEEMTRDPNLLAIGEDITPNGGLFGATNGLLDQFGSARVMDMPISEAGFVGFAIGCALAGHPTVVEMMNFDFVSLAIDQLCNRANKLRYMTAGQASVPIVVRGPTTTRIGLAGQHSNSMEAAFLAAPGLRVVNPATPADAKGLLKSAIRDPDPTIFIEHRLLYASVGDVPEGGDVLVPIGKARIAREGSDVTIIAHSYCVTVATAAARRLDREFGISAEIVDLRTVKPLDEIAICESVAKTRRVVLVTEGNVVGGVASEVAALIASRAVVHDLLAPLAFVGVQDVPIPYSEALEKEIFANPERVVRAAQTVMERASASAAT